MDINKKEILVQNFTPQKFIKEILLSNNNINVKNSPKLKKISIKNMKKCCSNQSILEKTNKPNNFNDRNNTINENKNKMINKTLPLDKMDNLNEITISSLAQENNLLKKEIEIVKSNLIISDEKEQLHKKTIQRIKRINQENEIFYKNSINLINDYKKREIDYQNKIKEMENDFSIKEEKLNNELSIIKNEIFNKNTIISDLNNKINHLNEQIINLKKIITEKNEIIFLLSKNNNQTIESYNNLNERPTLTTSKSCNNIIPKKNKTEKNLYNLRNNNNYNSFRNIEKMKLNDIVKNNIINNQRDNSYHKSIIPNKTYNNKNSLKFQLLKKNLSNKNINLNYNSFNYSKNKIPNMIYNTNINNKNKKRKNIHFKKSFNKEIINTDRTLNYNIKEIGIINKNRIKLSPPIKNIEKKTKRNNIIEFNNYSFYLNDIERSQPNKLLYINEEIIKNKKINNNSIFNQFKNKKNKADNLKILCSKKKQLIEINKYYQNNISNSNSTLPLGNASSLSHK